MTMTHCSPTASDNHSELQENLAVLRAVDAAHQCGKISRNGRYQILQSLFPATESRLSNEADFSTCRTSPTPGEVIPEESIADTLQRDRASAIPRHSQAVRRMLTASRRRSAFEPNAAN